MSLFWNRPISRLWTSCGSRRYVCRQLSSRRWRRSRTTTKRSAGLASNSARTCAERSSRVDSPTASTSTPWTATWRRSRSFVISACTKSTHDDRCRGRRRQTTCVVGKTSGRSSGARDRRVTSTGRRTGTSFPTVDGEILRRRRSRWSATIICSTYSRERRKTTCWRCGVTSWRRRRTCGMYSCVTLQVISTERESRSEHFIFLHVKVVLWHHIHVILSRDKMWTLRKIIQVWEFLFLFFIWSYFFEQVVTRAVANTSFIKKCFWVWSGLSRGLCGYFTDQIVVRKDRPTNKLWPHQICEYLLFSWVPRVFFAGTDNMELKITRRRFIHRNVREQQ